MHIVEIPSFFTPYGGEFCLDQARALHTLGHEVRIVSNVQLSFRRSLREYLLLPYGEQAETVSGIPVYKHYMRGIPRCIRPNVRRWIAGVHRMFRRYVSRHGRPDVLHAHCCKWGGYAAMLLSEEYGIPYVITEHLPLMLLEEEFNRTSGSLWQVPMLRRAYGQAACVVPVSEELVEQTACYYGKDYRWQYISNTIDTHFFSFRERAPRAGRPFRFCCLADFYPRKGYDILFPAFQMVRASFPDAELHIAGLYTDGDGCKEMMSLLGGSGVHVYGRLDKTAVRNLLYASDALVLASRSEVQPLVLLEAMSTGLPVISTECVPRSERIAGGCTIVPIADVRALAVAMVNEASRAEFDGRSLSLKIQHLASPEVVGLQLERLFKKVTGNAL